MDRRLFQVWLMEAVEIKNVNRFSTTDVYAIVSVSGGAVDNLQRFITPVVIKHGGTHPRWSDQSPFTFTLDEAALKHNRLTLKIELVSVLTLKETKIGEAVIPVSQLLEACRKDYLPYVTYTVIPQGKVHFACNFVQVE